MKNSKGITLMALVITIIVLLILAAVSIVTLTGQNGILTKATKAKTDTKYHQDMEIIRMALNVDNIYWMTDKDSTDEDIFLKELRKTDENAEVDYESNYPDSAIVYYNKDYYEVDYKTREVSKYEKESEFVARIGNVEYETLQAAFDAVPENEEETEVVLLKNITTYCEKGNVKKNQNIILQLENRRALMDIQNEGNLKITNGYLITNRRFLEGSIINQGELNIENMKGFQYYIDNYGTLNVSTVEKAFGSAINQGVINIRDFSGSDSYNIYNSFENEGEIYILDSNIYGFSVDNKKNIKIENTYLDLRPVKSYVINNEGKCEILGNTNITSDDKSFGSDDAIIVNKENAEFVMSGGSVTGETLIKNEGTVRLSGSVQAIGTGFTGIKNESSGMIYISDNVYIRAIDTGIRNSGNIEMTSGKIEANNNEYSYAIYNNNNKEAVILGENAITIPRNYNVD